MRAALRERAVHLRKTERLSYSAIAKKLNVAKSTLSYWLTDLPLSDREILVLRRKSWEKGEAAREKFRNTMRSKKAKEADKVYRSMKARLLTLTRKELFIAGLTLYIGEGDKRNPHRIALANSDPLVISFFAKWLVEFLDISREKIRFGLHLYSNMVIANERKFWQDTLGFGRTSFYKDQIRPVRTTFSYAEGNRHGTCTVYVIGSKPKTELTQAIRVLQENMLRV